MRNKLLILIFCGLPIIAAEKSRDWQTGKIAESADQTKAQIHTIAAKDKNYLVKGWIGNGEVPAEGSTVRFAVEGKTMFISMDGKEYKLTVLGERVGSPSDPAEPGPPAPPSPPVAPRPAPSPDKPVVTAVKPSLAPDKPAAEAAELLDNDAVVKMILGGLRDTTVISVIQARPGKYTLTAEALAGLRAAGVPQNVIAAMSAKMNAKP
jgi:hypothetical protein